MKRSGTRKGKIRFINAVNEVTRERAQSFLRTEHIRKIVDAYESDDDIPGLSRLGKRAVFEIKSIKAG